MRKATMDGNAQRDAYELDLLCAEDSRLIGQSTIKFWPIGVSAFVTGTVLGGLFMYLHG